MARLRRRWRVVKWVGVTLTCLIATAWMLSIPWMWFYQQGITTPPQGSTLRCQWSIQRGAIMYLYSFGLDGVGQPFKFNSGLQGSPNLQPVWWPFWTTWKNQVGECAMPLWICCLLVSIPTGVLFWRDRRRSPPHCCQGCGYDLTGNTSGRCSECGGRA